MKSVHPREGGISDSNLSHSAIRFMQMVLTP